MNEINIGVLNNYLLKLVYMTTLVVNYTKALHKDLKKEVIRIILEGVIHMENVQLDKVKEITIRNVQLDKVKDKTIRNDKV
jgi:hypothetical protein